MSQVVIVPHVLQHGHDPLKATIHQTSSSWDHISAASISIIPLLSVTAVEGIVEVKKVKVFACGAQFLTKCGTLSTLSGSSQEGTKELDGRLCFWDEGHPVSVSVCVCVEMSFNFNA